MQVNLIKFFWKFTKFTFCYIKNYACVTPSIWPLCVNRGADFFSLQTHSSNDAVRKFYVYWSRFISFCSLHPEVYFRSHHHWGSSESTWGVRGEHSSSHLSAHSRVLAKPTFCSFIFLLFYFHLVVFFYWRPRWEVARILGAKTGRLVNGKNWRWERSWENGEQRDERIKIG